MRNKVLSLSASFGLSVSSSLAVLLLSAVSVIWTSEICLAAEPAKPKVNLNQRASDAAKDIGDNMNKAGAAIKKSVDNAGKNIKQADKGNSPIKGALKKVETEADKAEHAIVTTVKDLGKKATNGGAGKSGSASGGQSLDKSMKELGKNAEKAGTAMENGVKKLGADAKKQIEKADQNIKKNTEHK